MKILTIDDLNFAEIETNILARTSWQADHLIWSVDKGQHIPDIGNMKFVLPHAIRDELPHERYLLSPNIWWYMITKRKIIPQTHKLVSACDTSGCIAHGEILPRKQNGVFKMEEFEYAQALKRLHNFFSAPDENGCIRWKGAYDHGGYGRYKLIGSGKSFAHDASWMLANKSEIPQGCVIRHQCDHPWCVNCEHLELGTPQENSNDRKDHGVQLHGEYNSNATISSEKARQIIESFGNGKTQEERSKEFDVSKWIIETIDQGRTWVHLMSPNELQIRQEKSEKAKENRLTESEVCEILASKDQGSRKERADKYGVSVDTVRTIDLGLHTLAPSEARRAVLASRIAEIHGDKYFESVKAKIQDKCTEVLGDDNILHLLFDDNPTTKEDGTRPPRMQYNNKPLFVHTVSFLVHNKRLAPTPGLVIRHKCRYKFCVSPDCLEEGTQGDNMKDKIRDGTVLRGSQNPNASLTESQVELIKQTRDKASQRARGIAFDATSAQVSQIDRGSTWAYIEAGEASQETLDKVKAVADNLKANRKKSYRKRKISHI